MNSTKIVVLLVLVFFAPGVHGQEENADCSAVFSNMVEKLEANYIGLRHFQDMGRGDEYTRLKRQYEGLTQRTPLLGCTEVLQDFLNFFEDGHLFATENPEYSEVQKDSVVNYSRHLLEINQINEQLEKQKESVKTGGDKILGKYSDGETEIGIISNGDFYDAFVLKSKREEVIPGELKARFRWTGREYKINYHTYGHASRFLTGDLYKEQTLLKISGGITWVKTDSPNKNELEMVDWEKGFKAPKLIRLDDESVLFSIPSWSLDYQEFAAFVKENRDMLLDARNLIFDIRGNTGGNGIYFSFFYVFADRNYPGGQGKVLASPDNEAYFQRNLRFSKDIYQPVVDSIKNNPAQIVDGPKYPMRKFRQLKRSKVENVAILTDEACMSAAESFILHSKKASGKVMTFGSPTRGVIDYTSIFMVSLESGNQKIMFGYPTSTLHKDIPNNGYNKTGIIPDVPIEPNVKDKVAFIMEYYSKRR